MNTHHLFRPLLLVALSALTLTAAQADSGRLLPRDTPLGYTQECAACHTGADQGDFDEDRLRFPAGLDERHRRAFKD
jgi:hypothetical protein